MCIVSASIVSSQWFFLKYSKVFLSLHCFNVHNQMLQASDRDSCFVFRRFCVKISAWRHDRDFFNIIILDSSGQILG